LQEQLNHQQIDVMKSNSSSIRTCPVVLDPETANATQPGRPPVIARRTAALARFSGALAILTLTTLGALPTLAAPPANDDISGAVVVTEPLPFSHTVSTVEATTAVDDPNCVGNGPSVWYVFTASADGHIRVDTFGSDYDTTLSGYIGAPGSLIQIGCNDDSLGLQSQLNLPVTAGTTYYFMAGAFLGGPGGNLVFNADVGASPAVVSLAVAEPVVAVPSTGVAKVQVQVSASSPVFIFALDALLVQATGRGNIVAMASNFIFEQTDAYSALLTLKDLQSIRTQGTGFVGGPARLQMTLAYHDPVVGFQTRRIDQEVRLFSSNGR